MRYATFMLLASPLFLVAQTTPKASGILNGASFSGDLAPGALAALFGTNLATGAATAQSLPLPKDLLGTKVLVQDPSLPDPIVAPLYFVSPGQVNFQVPFEVVRTNVSISVSTPQGTSNAIAVNLSPMAPGIFSQTADGAGTALAFDSGFRLLTKTPAAGSTVIFYATGLGITAPPATSGAGGNSSVPLNQVTAPFDVYVGGTKATVAWAGLAPGFAGVYQINAVPSGSAIGDVVIRCGGCSESNHVRMPQAPVNSGDNTANSTGSVTILYPSNQPTVTYTPAALVAKVTAQFDIKPSAERFTLSVVAKIGSTTVDGTTIQFDPVLGQFTATMPSPTQVSRLGDFSQTGVLVQDFLAKCGTGYCPMPGNIVPLSRQDAALVSAFKLVPLANSFPGGIHAFYAVTGGAKAGTTFKLGGSTNIDLTTFASFGSVPYPAGDVPVSVRLSVDGQVLDSATATYKPPQ